MGIPFVKMHGAGNDFVVIDRRRHPVTLDEGALRAIADRHFGVGCDQVIAIDPPTSTGASAPGADIMLRFWNPDGGEAGACGNGTRCAASLILDQTGKPALSIETIAGLLGATNANGRITIDMGRPRTDWQQIPVAYEVDTLHLPLTLETLTDPVGTSMGNPHATFFVADAEQVDIARLGPRLEYDTLFPERANIGVASLIGPDHLRLRVWERGAGLTLACGTGACAAAVAAIRRGLTGRSVDLDVDGGRLHIDWRTSDGHVLMTGPVAISFSGELSDALLKRQVGTAA